MNEVINVQMNEQNEQRVSARELYKILEVKTRFNEWFASNSKMFKSDTDYTSAVTTAYVGNGATRQLEDYSMTLEMAKHIALMSGTDKGTEIRHYFIQVEKEHRALLNNPQYQMAMGMKASQLLLDQKDKLIEEMQPKAVFADAVNVSQQTILVGDLAKLISQNGVQIGQNRLFVWLRNNGYLHKSGSQYNRPVQRYIDQGLFKVKESSRTNPDGSVKLTFTTKVTGKGQQYFVNKFLGTQQLIEV